MTRFGTAVGLALVLVVGCRGPGDGAGPGLPVAFPGAVAIVSASAAPPLRFGHPTPQDLAAAPLDATPPEALSLRVRCVALPGPPSTLPSRPLDEDAGAILDPATGELGLAPVLASGALDLDGIAAERLLALPRANLVLDLLAALPPRATLEVALRSEGPAPPPPTTPAGDLEPAPRSRQQIAVLVGRRSDPTRPASAPEPFEVALDLAADGGRRELLALAARSPSLPASFAWAVPSPLGTGSPPGTLWLAVAIDLAKAPAPGEVGAAAHARALEATLASLGAERERAGREALLPPAPLEADGSAGGDDSALLAAVAREAAPRAALLALAGRDGSPLLGDAALALPDALLAHLARAVTRTRARAAASETVAVALGASAAPAFARARPPGLALDVAALETLLAPGGHAVARHLLERRFGVAADEDPIDPRRPFLRRAATAQEAAGLARLVLARNLAALDDPRPGVRVRAARWLASSGGLEGYDPFGPLEERRAAIDRLWATRQAREGAP